MKKSFVTLMALVAGVSFASAEDKKVTGTLSLDAYSHFISYGADVWGDGDNIDSYAFNPLLELGFDLGGGWSATLGTWWDVNGKGTGQTIGGNLQEVDVWAGVGYETGIYSASVTYQQWFYGGDTEHILDIGLGLDVAYSPSITIHNRLSPGAADDGVDFTGSSGTIVVFGLEKGFECGSWSFGVPVNLAYFATDDFHGDGKDTGIGYGSVGLTVSHPLSFLDSGLGGEWAFNAGATLFVTDDDIAAPADGDETFVVTNFGVSLAF